jgi:hypothetical protein
MKWRKSSIPERLVERWSSRSDGRAMDLKRTLGNPERI